MLIRTVIAVAAVAVGVTTALAQDVIAERKALMKRSGDQAKLGAQMARGQDPFDLAKAQAVLATYADKAAKLPNLFPATSKTGDTRAMPAIWDKPAEWQAAIKKFADDAKAAQAAAKDLDSFKTAFANVAKNCGGCHETFRKPQ
jgi:cytochrome c556